MTSSAASQRMGRRLLGLNACVRRVKSDIRTDTRARRTSPITVPRIIDNARYKFV